MIYYNDTSTMIHVYIGHIGHNVLRYNPGDTVFDQKAPRHHLFLVVRGECAVLRRIIVKDKVSLVSNSNTDANNGNGGNNGNSENNGIDIEVSLGMRILAGDFSFLDGEGTDWVSENRTKELDVQDNGFEYLERGRLQPLFGRHKHSLIALTPVEVVILPLHEIAKSFSLFYSLLRIVDKKYASMQVCRRL